MIRKAGHGHLVPKTAQEKMGGLNFLRYAKKLLNRLAQENEEVHQKARTVKSKPSKSKENFEVLFVWYLKQPVCFCKGKAGWSLNVSRRKKQLQEQLKNNQHQRIKTRARKGQGREGSKWTKEKKKKKRGEKEEKQGLKEPGGKLQFYTISFELLKKICGVLKKEEKVKRASEVPVPGCSHWADA